MSAEVRALSEQLRDLRESRLGRYRSRKIYALESKRAWLISQLRPDLVAEAHTDWRLRREPGTPTFRLPPDGWLGRWVDEWIKEQCGSRYPVRFEKREPLAELDLILRGDQSQPDPPFLQLTELRVPNEALIAACAAAELGTLKLLRANVALRGALHHWKHNNRANPAMLGMLSTRSFLHPLPGTAVAYRSVRLMYPAQGQARCWRHWVTTRHLEMRDGDVVTFSKPMSSTLDTYHYGSIMQAPPDWRDRDANDISADGTWKPPAIRIELAPRAAMPFSELSGQVVGSHLGGEHELIHPPHTYWRVSRWSDVAYEHAPGHVRRSVRYPTVHLQQIDPDHSATVIDDGRPFLPRPQLTQV